MMTAYKSKNLKEFTLVWALAITGQWNGCTTNFPLDAFALLYFPLFFSKRGMSVGQGEFVLAKFEG
jgi:hypothetical protein